MSELSTAVCSITRTQRRRFFWAAWWTGVPSHAPFRSPDASGGGARSEDEALQAAQRSAARHLALTEPYWARAWKCVVRGEPVPAPPALRQSPVEGRTSADERGSDGSSAHAPPASAWSVLGVQPGASLAEVKQAFRKRALETHPDQGGDAALFRELSQAYQKVLVKLRTRARRMAR